MLPAFPIAPPAIEARLALQERGTVPLRLGYFPVRVEVKPDKPAGIVREPTYAAAPKYGLIKLGDGPKAAHVVALDEPADGPWKVYIDANGDGDLTNDGAGAWSQRREQTGGRVVYGVNSVLCRASWGAPEHETSAGDYSLGVYRIVSAQTNALFIYREAARATRIQVDGAAYRAYVVENDADGLFNKALDDDGKPLPGNVKSDRPVWLVLEAADGKKLPAVDARQPFPLAGKNYVAELSADGARLALRPTERKVTAPKEAVAEALLASGTAAPEFEVIGQNGPLKLSDLKGKVVILDFWATWCGPCKASMPHLEEIWKKVQGKDVAVLAVCVWDNRAAYDAWIPANKDKYTFPVAFDPAAEKTDASIAKKLFKVSGIPTTYVLDQSGKVIASVVGYEAGDKRLEAALKKAGIALD